MGHSQYVLSLCQALQESGLESPNRTGRRFSRGFSDVGAEEFIALSQDDLVSLSSGERKQLSEEEGSHLSWIPDVDHALEELDRMEWDIQKIEHVDRRTWLVQMAKPSTELSHIEQSPRLQEALLKCLYFALTGEIYKELEGRNLRTATEIEDRKSHSSDEPS